MSTQYVLLALLIALYAIFAGKLARLSITMPIVFVLAGILFGSDGLGLIVFSPNTKTVELVIEITLAFFLFSSAAGLKIGDVSDDASLPGRLLLIGFPLTVALGALVAFAMFSTKGVGAALLIGAILAPTDAALGLPVFNNPRVPVRIRRALNIESGLNDGLAAPLVTLFAALALEQITSARPFNWLLIALSELAIAVVIGALVGLAGGWLFQTAQKKNWTTKTALLIGNLALAAMSYFGSITLGGNGFVAAFTGGLLFAYITRGQMAEQTEYTDITGSILSLFVWVVFGSSLAVPLLQKINLQAVLYAVLSLTLIRMLPMSIALLRSGLRRDTVAMIGWLGPRGLASVAFLLMVMEQAEIAEKSHIFLTEIVGWTVLLSIILHGLSAIPLANWYARRLETASPDTPELQDMPELHKSGVHILSNYKPE